METTIQKIRAEKSSFKSSDVELASAILINQ
ncbi:hypothetical protein [Pseudomonas farris]